MACGSRALHIAQEGEHFAFRQTSRQPSCHGSSPWKELRWLGQVSRSSCLGGSPRGVQLEATCQRRSLNLMSDDNGRYRRRHVLRGLLTDCCCARCTSAPGTVQVTYLVLCTLLFLLPPIVTCFMAAYNCFPRKIKGCTVYSLRMMEPVAVYTVHRTRQ
jgi:hypothetical protein